MAKSSAKVVIVGAGVAGVTAAAWLVNNGLSEVIVLEAQDYIGGRVKGEIVDGKPIDLGAQYIHGWEGNPAYDIAHKLGIVEDDDDDEDKDDDDTILEDVPEEFITSGGEKVLLKRVLPFLEFLHDEIENNSSRYQNKDDESSKINFVLEAKNKYMDLHMDNLSQEDIQLNDAVYRWVQAYENLDNATADLRELSPWGTSKYVMLKGRRLTDVHGGMVAILKAIINLVSKEIIQLNTPVIKIDWSSEQETSKKGNVIVTCKNGDVIEAEHVIVTISTGCMQAHHKEMFYPALPGAFQTALQHIGFGGIGKIFLKWEKPFWDLHDTEDFESFELLWLDSYPISITSDRSQKKTRFGKPWWYGTPSVEAVIDHPNMLEFWLTLDQAEIVEELDDDEVLDVCHELLQIFLKEYENIPKPVKIYKSNWLANPYTRGTYSYPKHGIQEEHFNNFGAPLPSSENPRVLFAGEAYSLDFISTFHGALLSGQAKADQILKLYGIQVSQKLIDLIKVSGN